MFRTFLVFFVSPLIALVLTFTMKSFKKEREREKREREERDGGRK